MTDTAEAIEQLLARARRLEPIPPPSAQDEQIEALLAKAGRYQKVGVQEEEADEVDHCLRHAAAATLRVPWRSLPRVPRGEERFERWIEKMRRRGYELLELEIPPSDGQPWVAVVDSGEHTHAVGLIGMTAIHHGRELRTTFTPAQILSGLRFRAAA